MALHFSRYQQGMARGQRRKDPLVARTSSASSRGRLPCRRCCCRWGASASARAPEETARAPEEPARWLLP